MGCNTSKAENEAATEEKTHTQEPPPQATDPRLPLSARDIFRLKKSWKGIKRRMEWTGMDMFVRMFQVDSSLQELFKSFRGLSTDNLRETQALEAHARLVMGRLDEMFEHIEDVDKVVGCCERIKATHGIFQGFTIRLFWNMEEPFLAAVQSSLGDAYNDEMGRIYRDAIHFILTNLSDTNPSHNSNHIQQNGKTPTDETGPIENG